MVPVHGWLFTVTESRTLAHLMLSMKEGCGDAQGNPKVCACPVLSVLSMTGFRWADSLLSTPQEEGRSRGWPSTCEDQILWKSDAAECLLLRGMGYSISWKEQKAGSSQLNWLRKANWILTYVLDTLKNVSVSLGPVSSKKDVKLCNATWRF